MKYLIFSTHAHSRVAKMSRWHWHYYQEPCLIFPYINYHSFLFLVRIEHTMLYVHIKKNIMTSLMNANYKNIA